MSRIVKVLSLGQISSHRLLEFVGAGCGIIGALLMAINPAEYAAIAFPVWLISSIALAAFAHISKLPYLLMLQLTFTVINLIGIWGNSFSS
ncbi:hypothetical protein [Thiomicrospira sp.]|uniref:hypothetical protein n=1 Tax=Thiomicrospira sp. TaxID=935 RepID=UPI002F92FC9D